GYNIFVQMHRKDITGTKLVLSHKTASEQCRASSAWSCTKRTPNSIWSCAMRWPFYTFRCVTRRAYNTLSSVMQT
ncbi:hypothetical protein HAX54_031557, partial [Datura stramonium]|nr:hypothetical protein [Datura stramonium]